MILTVLTCLFFLISVPLTLIGLGMYIRKNNGQKQFDYEREWYLVIFPNGEITKSGIEDFTSSIGDNLRGGSTWDGVPTVVFEIEASSEKGIEYRIGVPWQAAAYLVSQLRGAIPGIDLVKIESRDKTGFQYGETLYMENPSEELPISDVARFANRIVRSVQNASDESDALVVQTIIAHSTNQKMPPSDKPVRSNRGKDMARAFLHVETSAGHDEIYSRRAKQAEQNYIAITRIAARGKDINRAQHLVSMVVQAFTAERGYAFLYPKRTDPQKISHLIAEARTPLDLTMQLSGSELTAVMGWPIGRDVYVAGLRRGSVRHMHVPESVEHEGIVIGRTTLPPNTRQVAVSFKKALTHFYMGGATEVGKTTMIANIARQVIDYGCGLVLLEQDGNLFEQMLEQIPPERIKDVTVIDTTRPDLFVGFNPLRTGIKPEVLGDQFGTLLNSAFKDAGESVYTSLLVRNGVPVLAELDKATLYDLFALVLPRTPEEKAWQSRVVKGIKDRTRRAFWEEWNKRDEKKKMQDANAFFNRMYQVFMPEATRYMLNQEESSFDPVDVIKNNKILLVNLAGVSKQVASVLGSLIVNAVWTAAKVKANVPEKRPNFLVLDEFQQFAHLKEETIDVFATARKRKLGLIVATQYIESLDSKVQAAVMANARNKIIFTSSVDSAYVHNRDFAHSTVKQDSFVNLPAFTVLTRLNTEEGVSPPMTVLTYPEPGADGAYISRTYNLGSEIMRQSAAKYGRTIAEIERDEASRLRLKSSDRPHPDTPKAPRNHEQDFDFGDDEGEEK